MKPLGAGRERVAAISASIVVHVVAAWGVTTLRPVEGPEPQRAMVVRLAPPWPAASRPDRPAIPPAPGRKALPLQPVEPVAARAAPATATASPPEPPPSAAPPTAARAVVAQMPAPSEEDQLDDYRRRLWVHLVAHAPAAPPGSGTVSVVFGIDARGALLFARLARSSGRPAFDRACLASVRTAAPLPAPPEGTAPADLVFTVPIRAAAAARRPRPG